MGGKIYAIANEKGGQAKTTTTLALVEGAARRGYKVLAVDADPQAALTYSLDKDDTETGGLYAILAQTDTPQTGTIRTRTENAYLWAGSGALAAIDAVLTGQDKFFAMRKALEAARIRYDYVFIDCPATVNTLHLSAMLSADQLLIPATPDAYSMRSIQHTLQSLQLAQEKGNPELQLAGILFTRCRNTTAQKSIISAARAAMGKRILGTIIRDRAAVQTAALLGVDLWTDGSTKDTAADYEALLDELKIRRL